MNGINTFRVEWTAKNQGMRYELVDALTQEGARDILTAKYGTLEGFYIYGVNYYNDTNKYEDTNIKVEIPQYHQNTAPKRVDYSAEFASLIAGGGGLLVFFGLFTIASGGIFLILLGALIFYLAVTFG